jgi:hypothetical protein
LTTQHQYTEIESALAAFVTPGQVFELRLLHRNSQRVDSGYFDSPANAATALSALNELYAGIYFTPNPVEPSLIARAYNRVDAHAKATTLDTHILRRQWLLIDIDPNRPSGISSTDQELSNAFKVANTIANMLEFEGWPRPYINVSGNGCHVMYRMDEPNTEEARDAIHQFLKTLGGRFGTDGCSIDTTTYNAARIFRVPGTWARKGDNTGTRFHRKAYIVHAPEDAGMVTLERIVAFNYRNSKYAPMEAKRNIHRNATPDDERQYMNLNRHAMGRLNEWVPKYFPSAREYKGGYRISSDALGLSFEEDLTIRPNAIVYFGDADQGHAQEGRRTPVGLLAEFHTGGDVFKAARALSDTLNVPFSEFSVLTQGLDSTSNPANLPGARASAPPHVSLDRFSNGASLLARKFSERKWIIPNVLPVGTVLLSARPKMRKSFLALQISMAVCGGRRFLDWYCEQGDVLFLGLEDNERRLRERIELLQYFDLNPPDLANFRYFTGGMGISPTNGHLVLTNPDEAARTQEMFPKGQNGVDNLKRALDTWPSTRLIVIDTYAHFREGRTSSDVYQSDVDAMIPITRMAGEREVCVIVVHHDKKGLAGIASADYMEDVSGSTGLTASVDAVLSIKGKRGMQEENEERQLLLSGRDISREMTIDMAFDAQRGGWLKAARQDVREAILALLRRHPFMLQKEFSSEIHTSSPARISQALTSMKLEGLIVLGRWGYSLPSNFKGD